MKTVGTLIELIFFEFELFELILLMRLDQQFPVERLEATVSQSTVPPPLTLTVGFHNFNLRTSI